MRTFFLFECCNLADVCKLTLEIKKTMSTQAPLAYMFGSFQPYHIVFISRCSLLSCLTTVDVQTYYDFEHFSDLLRP